MLESMSIIRRGLLGVLLYSSCYPGLALEQVSVEPDHADHLYRIGEAAKLSFDVTEDGKPVPNGKIRWHLQVEGSPDASGVLEADSSGCARMLLPQSRAGFSLLTVRGEDSSEVLCGIGTAPEEIRIDSFRPEDFDRFWTENLRELQAIPLIELERKAVPHLEAQFAGKLQCFDVKIAAPGDKPVSGYLILPMNAAPKSLPVLVVYLGAGVFSAIPECGYALKGAAVLCINAHGIPNGETPEFYEKLSKAELADYYLSGRESPESFYFKYLFLRAVRAVEYMRSLPEWDGKHVVVFGNSQGGAQALAAAALDSAVTHCVAGVPWMCNFRGAEGGWAVPEWPGFIPAADTEAYAPTLRTLPYYDMINFAPRIHAATSVLVGYTDTVCCPSGVYAMFHALGSDHKKLLPLPLYGHGDSETYEAAASEINHVLEGLLNPSL